MATALETGIDWGTKIDASVVTYHFAEAGGEYDGVTAYAWGDYEILQVERALALFETFLDLTFTEVEGGQHLTLVVGDNVDMEGFLGFFYPPGTSMEGLGAFNQQGAGWHELAGQRRPRAGRLRLHHHYPRARPRPRPRPSARHRRNIHDLPRREQRLRRLRRLRPEPRRLHHDVLQQGLGYQPERRTGGDFCHSATRARRWRSTLRSSQAKYGANLGYRTGADTYVLPTSNAVGTFYSSIWDAGGIDAIVHDGSTPAVIDLRPATLQVEPGGGGFLSYVDAVFGGFTIANGVAIENARGGSGADTIFGNAVGNLLEGRGGDDVIDGLGGADTIDGGGGADTMRGGAGDDSYVIDNPGDTADESAAGSAGIDEIRSSVSFSLDDGVHARGDIENLTLTGVGAIGGTGNALANLLVGNAAANVLDGGGGADTIRGGPGNDTYVVDNAGDTADESAAGSAGIDEVRSSVSFSLGDGVHARGDIENLTLSGAGAIDGTGNALSNTLVGNTGANTLRGGPGGDVLDGKRGRDSLIGGEDGDAFMFSVKPKKANADHVIDFVPGEDAIHLDHDRFAKLGLGELNRKAFHAAKNAHNAKDGKDRIIYDTESGKLRYDKDGKDGHKAKLFAILDDDPNDLSHHDFLIVA